VLPNKELKLTKPSIMELRSLTPVFGGPSGLMHGDGMMGSLKGAGSFFGAMALLVPVVSLVVDRAGEVAASGSTLSLGWRFAIALTNWYVRFLPFIAIGGVALATVIGGYLSRRCSIIEERRALLVWLIVAVLYLALPVVSSLTPSIGRVSSGWIHGLTPLMAMGIVAPLATVVTGVHLQARIRHLSSSRVRGWHIAVASLVLAVLGPAALIPSVWVWTRAGEVATPSPVL